MWRCTLSLVGRHVQEKPPKHSHASHRRHVPLKLGVAAGSAAALVHVDNDESDESYESSWSYVQHIQSNALFGHDRRTFHKEVTNNKVYKLLILKNRVELAQFQNTAPQYMTLSVDFWKALSSLPLTYDYSAYRQVLKTYGTHYMSEGSLGGEYQGLLEIDLQSDTSHSKDLISEYCYS
ncbi:hypothetical protein GOODEAATRI_026488 [Goodea atripinnis]|uniref:MACPF domain-containing protein n=1 Tax=Goodea atripinnis TaxID=208336 RepID=A0ABV0NDW4_9TELE